MGVLVIQGGPGTGKTHTLVEIRRKAEKLGALCLAVNGFHDERKIRFAALTQLTHAPGIPGGLRSALLRLIDRAAPGALSDHLPARLLREVVSEMAECAARQRLLLTVDDVHQADPASQSCLLHIVRRVESHDVTVAVAFPHTYQSCIVDPLEFLSPDARLIKTTALREAEVSRLLEERTDAATARRLAPDVHAISGGNLALATALVDDVVRAGPLRTGNPIPVGDSFRTACLGVLVRHPHLAACVEALTVLGESATRTRVARLLDQCPAVTGTYFDELEEAGMLTGGTFRHPALPGFVAASMDGTRLRQLHRRAGELLFSEGASATVVARYLIVADEVPDISQVRVLLYASHHLLLVGQVEEAVACLRLADRADLDDGHRNQVATALIGTLWWANPGVAEPEVRRLLAAARKGQVHCHALRLLVVWLLWFGWRDLARETLARVTEQCGPDHDHGEELVRDLQTLIGYLRPELLEDPAVSLGPPSGGHPAHSWALLADDCAGSARPHGPVPAHDTTLRREELSDACRFWTRDLMAVLRLVREGEMRLAYRSCAELLNRMPPGDLAARRAFLSGLHAHICWSLGDLSTALSRATSALDLLPDHSWGIAIGLPLSAMINAHTALGDLDRAADYLERPVPREMQGSFFGALYHLARGRRLLSAGQAGEALNAFVSCAPACEPPHTRALDLLGWRASAAEAHLALGEPEEARRMARAELTALGARPTDARGRALTVLAALAEVPERRRAHLEEAERVLRSTGSRLSLAGVLAQLSRLDLAEGNTGEARARRNEALGLAHQCGVPERGMLPSPFPPGPHMDSAVPPGEAVPVQGGGQAASRLSEAEWRVASLAAEGRSNRQIAKELFVTVSTVEQHLTRVYRKLEVHRRSDLSELLLSSH